MWAVLGSNDFFSLSGISWEDGTRLGYFRAVASPDCNYKWSVLWNVDLGARIEKVTSFRSFQIWCLDEASAIWHFDSLSIEPGSQLELAAAGQRYRWINQVADWATASPNLLAFVSCVHCTVSTGVLPCYSKTNELSHPLSFITSNQPQVAHISWFSIRLANADVYPLLVGAPFCCRELASNPWQRRCGHLIGYSSHWSLVWPVRVAPQPEAGGRRRREHPGPSL